MLVRKCDCCGHEIGDSEYYYALKIFEYKNDAGHKASFPHIDLCDSCNKELNDYYYNGMKLKGTKLQLKDEKIIKEESE